MNTISIVIIPVFITWDCKYDNSRILKKYLDRSSLAVLVATFTVRRVPGNTGLTRYRPRSSCCVHQFRTLSVIVTCLTCLSTKSSTRLQINGELTVALSWTSTGALTKHNQFLPQMQKGVEMSHTNLIPYHYQFRHKGQLVHSHPSQSTELERATQLITVSNCRSCIRFLHRNELGSFF